MHDVAGQPAARRAARAECGVRSRSTGGGHDQLLALEEPERPRVGVDERRRLLDHLVEHRRRIELAREQPARACQLLGESARRTLGLEQLTAFERAARRVGEMPRELQVVFAERALLVEEDEDETSGGFARRVDRHGDQRGVAVGSCGRPHVGQQALVVGDGGRDEDAPVGGCAEERPLLLGGTPFEDAPEILREPIRPDGFEPPARGHEDCRRAAAQSLRRCLRDRLERGRARKGLTEHRCDPVEAALDPGLACALREHLGVAQRECRQTGERLQDVRILLLEAAPLAPADPQDAEHLVAPEHGGRDHIREAVVGGVRNRRGDLAVGAVDQWPALTGGCPGQAVTRGKLEADERAVEAVHRDAAEMPTVAVEEVAVRGVRIEELGELIGESLQDDGQIELAAEDMRGAQERGLLRQLLLVSLQGLFERNARAQPLESGGRLRGERLHHRQVLVREDPGLLESRDGDHRNHALGDEQWDEGGALRSDGRGQPCADDARALGVVDGERRGLEDGAGDSRRLMLEVEADVSPPVDVLPVRTREVAGCFAPIVRDEGERNEGDVEQLGELVEQRPRDALDIDAPRHLLGDPADALELLCREGTPLLARVPTAQDRAQEHRCGRDAAERANRRKLVRNPHWAPQIVRSRANRHMKSRPDVEKPAARGVGAAGSPDCSPRAVRRRAAVRIAQ